MCQTQSPKNTVSSLLSDTSMQSSWSRISTLDASASKVFFTSSASAMY